MSTKRCAVCIAVWVLAALVFASAYDACAQAPASTNLEGFALKIFRVESGLYPFVQVYFRTFDQNKQPLVNLNEMNIGVMVKGRSYDPAKRQYMVQSIRNRSEATRAVLVIDCSKTMAGAPFEGALKAMVRFFESKRPQDQFAIIAIRDTTEGYELVSNFERDPNALARRLADVKCDGMKTRLYDAIGAALQMCGMVSQGGTSTQNAEYIISNSIVVFSDGMDEGSALSREELNTRIANLSVPVPVYSLGYSRVGPESLKNLQALSNNSFGIYYPLGETTDKMQRCVEEILNILQNDYVVTFRSYVPVDGESHALKIGVEYPSRSGKMTYQGANLEAIEPPPVQKIMEERAKLDAVLKLLPDGNPYLTAAGAVPAAVAAPAAPPAAAPAAPPAAAPAH
jgi:Mg-chelatase subunit ChlD